jgi:hypothetical protein
VDELNFERGSIKKQKMFSRSYQNLAFIKPIAKVELNAKSFYRDYVALSEFPIIFYEGCTMIQLFMSEN